MIEALIVEALRARLAAFTPVLPIHYQNGEVFVPPTSAGKPLPYFKEDLLWNRNINRGISHVSTTEHRGIYQITVLYPSATGLLAVTNVAGLIAAWFERGTVIAVIGCTVNIQGKPYLSGLMQDGVYVRMPVTISFYGFD